MRIAEDKCRALKLHDIIHSNYRSGDVYSSGLKNIKYRFSLMEAAVMDAVTSGAAVFMTLRDQLELSALGDAQRAARGLDEREQRFVTLSALYAGCAESAATLEQHLGGERLFENMREGYRTHVWGTANQPFTLADDKEALRDSVLKLYVEKLVIKQGVMEKVLTLNGNAPDKNLGALTHAFYQSLLDHLDMVRKSDEYKDLESMFSLALELPHTRLSGFSRPQSLVKPEEGGFQLDVTWEDIIGNDEAKELLKSTIENLFRYDPKTRTNLFLKVGGKMPRTVLLYAGPGTGKTMTLKAAIRYAHEMAERTGKPLHVVEVSQLFKDKYVGESQKKLDEMLNEGMDPNGIGIITIEDVDALFMNRSGEDTSGGSSEVNALQTILNKLEGVRTQYWGNWLILATTNRAHGTDKALKERLARTRVYCPGAQTEEEFTRLIKGLSKPALDAGYFTITPKEEKEAAKLCVEFGYHGRIIRNAVESLLTRAGIFELGDELLLESDEEKFRQAVLQKFKPIRGTDLLESLRKAAEDDEREAQYDMEERTKAAAERWYVQRKADIIANKRFSKEESQEMISTLDKLKEDGKLQEYLKQVRDEVVEELEEKVRELREENERLKKKKK